RDCIRGILRSKCEEPRTKSSRHNEHRFVSGKANAGDEGSAQYVSARQHQIWIEAIAERSDCKSSRYASKMQQRRDNNRQMLRQSRFMKHGRQPTVQEK